MGQDPFADFNEPSPRDNPYEPPRAPNGYGPTPRPSSGAAAGFAIASLVIGCVEVIFLCCMHVFSAPLPIAGLVLGVLGLKSDQRVLAIVGIVLNTIWLLLCLFFLILFIVAIATGPGPEGHFEFQFEPG